MPTTTMAPRTRRRTEPERWMMTTLLVLVVTVATAAAIEVTTSSMAEEDVCDCETIEMVTTKDTVLRKHGRLLGRYVRRTDSAEEDKGDGDPRVPAILNQRPTYRHFTGDYFLYYSNRSQGFWAVGESLASDVVRLENQGDRMCPYYLKSMWRYADGDLNALVYDVSLRAACMSDPCSVVKCGHQAVCLPPPSQAGAESEAKVEVRRGDLRDTINNAVLDLLLGPPPKKNQVTSRSNETDLRDTDENQSKVQDDLANEDEDLHDTTETISTTTNTTTTTTKTTTATTTTTEKEAKAICRCREGFTGNPYERCFPILDQGDPCRCERLVFSSRNPQAVAKHESSYGEYFLFDRTGGDPVYQHFAGIEYLYKRDGHWLISDKIGLHEAGLQNQGDPEHACPYRFRTSWEYADVERSGWQWVYDHTAAITCPTDPCSVTRCGFHASCTAIGNKAICTCDIGYEHGNPYDRCYPAAVPAECGCREVLLSSQGPSALAQSDKMGRYLLFGYYNGRPAYQHQSGLDYLYFAEGEAWVIGAMFGGARVGIVNFGKGDCPYRLTGHPWRHSVGGKLERDPAIRVQCHEGGVDLLAPQPAGEVRGSTTMLPLLSSQDPDHHQDPPPSMGGKASAERLSTTSVASSAPLSTSTLPSTTVVSSVNNEGPQSVSVAEVRGDEEPAMANASFSDEGSSMIPGLESSHCDCPLVVISSRNPDTIEKHGNQLGSFRLQRFQDGRPVYRHEAGEQYLYYHPFSGGNWLVNTEVGLLFGGIQNSKDLPLCPYLINTMWQYGDSALGGWVYDPTMRVTCPSDPCSVLRCGFRAQCVYDDTNKAHCVCRPGFVGNPEKRCYPERLEQPCSCLDIRLVSYGPSRHHQADKMGRLHLWGYYNGRPVYQHASGLDFLYYHKNNVWGVGPQIGGNSAGLLNFGANPCPYELSAPWEYGTRRGQGKQQQRLVDFQLTVTCLNAKGHFQHLQPPVATTTTTTIPSPTRSGSGSGGDVQATTPNAATYLSYQTNFEQEGSSFHQGEAGNIRDGAASKVSPDEEQEKEYEDNFNHLGPCGLVTAEDPAGSFAGSEELSVLAHHPWQAELVVDLGSSSSSPPPGGGSSKMHLCSAVILSLRHVLAPASCLTDHPMKKYRVVVASPSDLTQWAGKKQEFHIQSIFTHDSFDDGDRDFEDDSQGDSGSVDLALVKLKGKHIRLGPYVQPLCLPEPKRLLDHVPPFGKECRFSGWGRRGTSGPGRSGAPLEEPSSANADDDIEGGDSEDEMQRLLSFKGELVPCPEDGPQDSGENLCVQGVEDEAAFEKGMPLACPLQGDISDVAGNSPTTDAKAEFQLMGLIKGEMGQGHGDLSRFLDVRPHVQWIQARLNM